MTADCFSGRAADSTLLADDSTGEAAAKAGKTVNCVSGRAADSTLSDDSISVQSMTPSAAWQVLIHVIRGRILWHESAQLVQLLHLSRPLPLAGLQTALCWLTAPLFGAQLRHHQRRCICILCVI